MVKGRGNFNTITWERIPVGDDFKIYDPTLSQSYDSKAYEQVIIPVTSSVNEIPAIKFSFFNPNQGKYVSLSSEPIAITVLNSPKGETFGLPVAICRGSGRI